ncbi:hypothetical protein BGW38_005814 [Lunasporangiospora selenospora]|uniref:Crotonobetainyl-CoA:carnitine CoA-transferase CaiB n=1 Tax=Lunasporangiospora selenospora TaxID=979761 RepID=A0A9P6KAM8_9FUNG|nr:hypothetical protein BGW38_005814 [Lunasporangiospora selenospora]
MAGHDINYLSISGVLNTLGRADERPAFPINLLADFAGGGLMCALGVLLALQERHRSGKGQVVDAAMVDGVNYLGSFVYNMHKAGALFQEPRGMNQLDGGAHFYDTYETKDGKYMAVGSIESDFYALLLKGLELDPERDQLPDQMKAEAWPRMKQLFREKFLTRTLEEWVQIFDGTDACVTPVLDYYSMPTPGPAPKLSRTPGRTPAGGEEVFLDVGGQSAAILREAGFDEKEIQTLVAKSAVSGVVTWLDDETRVAALCVNRLFYRVSIPIIWRSIQLETDFQTERNIFLHDEGFREGWFRNAIHIQTLIFTNFDLDVATARTIRDHCPYLRRLDLSEASTAIGALDLLIPFDVYATLSTPSPQKRKYDEFAELDDNGVASSLETTMEQFRQDVLSATDDRSVDTRFSLPLDQPAANNLRMMDKWTLSESTSSLPLLFPFFLKEIMTETSSGTTLQMLDTIGHLGPQLHKLNLTGVSGVSDKLVLKLLGRCHNVTLIGLEGAAATDALLTKLPTLTPRLKTLLLVNAKASAKGLVPLIRSSPLLKFIRVNRGTPRLVNSDVIKALVEKKLILTTPSTPPTPAQIPGPYMFNTTLTGISFQGVTVVDDTAFLTLMTFATALEQVTLDKTKVKDEALLALAKTSRNRILEHGFALPDAWIQHNDAEIRLGCHVGNADQTRAVPNLTGPVQGGLRVVSLLGCPNVTNKGIRVLVRSCPNLTALVISECPKVSLQLFQGPWAARKFDILSIRDLAFVVKPRKGAEAIVQEEKRELRRFPLRIESFADANIETILKETLFDPITTIKSQASTWTWDETQSIPLTGPRVKISASAHNHACQKALLKQFYEKLATMDRLASLDMNGVDFRVHVRDGLDLALPGLQKSLLQWHLFQSPPYHIDAKDMLWIGKYFGDGTLPRGFTLTDAEGNEDTPVKVDDDNDGKDDRFDDAKTKQEQADWHEREYKREKRRKKNRLSKLIVLTLNEGVMEHEIDYEIYEWFMGIIPDIRLDKGFDHLFF